MKLRTADRGNVMLELALVLPVIILILGAGVEVNRVLQSTEVAGVLSREAGNVAYRRCADFRETGATTAAAVANTSGRTAVCLDDVLNNADEGLQEFADNIAPDSRLIISVYRYDTTPGAAGLWSVARRGEDSSRGIISKFSLNPSKTAISGPATINLPLATSQERVVISEAFVPYNPVLRVVPKSLLVATEFIYDSSIF